MSASHKEEVGTAYDDHDAVVSSEGINEAHVQWWKEIQRCRANFVTKESIDQAINYKPRVGDLFITTPAKSGTTWMMQMCYQMATGGDMDFSDLTEVVPWIEIAMDLGLEVENKKEPRIFKSHFARELLPFSSEAKYIVVVRNPMDVAVSFFRFFQGWFADYDDSFFDFFVEQNLLADTPAALGRYFGHIRGWLAHLNDNNVLFLAFEQMKHSTEASMKRVAEFCGFPVGEEVAKQARGSAKDWEELVHYCSFGFMKEHHSKFDDLLVVEKINPKMGLPVGKYSGKVRSGESRTKQELLSEQMTQRINTRWNEVLGEHGYASYHDLLVALKVHNGLDFA